MVTKAGLTLGKLNYSLIEVVTKAGLTCVGKLDYNLIEVVTKAGLTLCRKTEL